MTIAEDLIRLEQLLERGSITADEFARAKARLLSGAVPPEPLLRALNEFRRSSSDRWFAGVCGGLARATGMESWLWRLLFTLLLLWGGGGLVLYLILWLLVPLQLDADPPATP
jgi:phage shock protein PspC (stress-responsive transcriptional regulator)